MKDEQNGEVDQESAIRFLLGFHAGEKLKKSIADGHKTIQNDVANMSVIRRHVCFQLCFQRQ